MASNRALGRSCSALLWRATLGVAALLVAACAQGGSATREDDGGAHKRTILLSTEYDDLKAGEDAALQIEAEMGLYDSPALSEYVAEVGRRLVAYAPLRPFQYTFQIVDQMTPNAFSLPGGHIYVSRGLIALVNTEDELANVLGHEIIHAAERHAAAQQELARRTSPFLMPYIRMARLAAYSRDHERAADKGGQTIAARAGYDPAALAEFLKHLGDTERLTIGYSRLSSYFDTHPGTTERVASTAAHAMTLTWTVDPTRVTGRAAYLQKIEGIVLDTDPAEGIFEDTEFIHPDLDFRIIFPRGWEVVNTREAVGALSPDGNARIFLTLEAPLAPDKKAGSAEKPGDGTSDGSGAADAPPAAPGRTAKEGEPSEPPTMPTPKEAADRFVAESGDEFRVHVVRAQPVQIGDIDSWRIDFEGSMGGQGVGGQATFLAHAGQVFRIMAVATSSSWSQYVGRAHAAARTFRPLTDEERRSVQVEHLRIAHALPDETVTALGQRTDNAWGPGRTAVLNGFFVDTRFQGGEVVKIARSVPYTPRPERARQSLQPVDPIGTDTPTLPGEKD